MQLHSIWYRENEYQPTEWTLNNLELSDINLIVGRNAVGKSRTINVINGIGRMLYNPSTHIPLDGHYKMNLRNENDSLDYELLFKNGRVILEILQKNNVVKLERGLGGGGTLFYEKDTQKLSFKSPEEQLAVVSRQDDIQHSYLSDLVTWGQGVYYYSFSSQMGKDAFRAIKTSNQPASDFRDQSQTVAIFQEGKKTFGDRYVDAILKDMAFVGYRLTEIGTRAPTAIKFYGTPLDFLGLYVKEEELRGETEQFVMSQGMFRVLATLIHVHYGIISLGPKCILIDDIGEGLDFERSISLIKLLIDRTKSSSIQLIMSTNDRFVMNSVPLEYWTVLSREKSVVNSYNHNNKKKEFNEFRFTGLSNFDFFADNFVDARPRG